MNLYFAKTFHAGGAILAASIVKFDGNGDVVQSSAAADLHVGVTDSIGDAASGDRIDVHMAGQPTVTASAAIAAGASITSDADGKAVTAGVGEIAIGFAVEASEADGDLITIHLARHKA